MARIPRIFQPGYLQHVTQRGNRRQIVFFNRGAYQAYLETGRPLGNETYIETAEKQAGRTLKPARPGRKRRSYNRD